MREVDLSINGVKLHKFIDRQSIIDKLSDVAQTLVSECAGDVPVFLCVLNGSFVFAADLLRQYEGDCEVHFVKVSSYEGIGSTGRVNTLIGLPGSLKGRRVYVVEDIVETGCTMKHVVDMLKEQEPADIRIVSLFAKPGRLKADIKVDHALFEIPDNFIVGYGLDYNGLYRNLPDIYSM